MSHKTIDNFEQNLSNFLLYASYSFIKSFVVYVFLCITNVRITQVYRNGYNFTSICGAIYALFRRD
jgi:hypothetical protein